MVDRKSPAVKIGSRRFHLPQSRWVRIGLGVTLVFFGFLGFLPVLGFWMIPLGLVVLSIDSPAMRRVRRRVEVWGARKIRTWRLGRS